MSAARTRAERAQANAHSAGLRLREQLRPWQLRARQHRVALLAGTGLGAGLAIALLPPRVWSRIGALLFGGGARVARSSMLPLVLATIWKALPATARVRAVAPAPAVDSTQRHA